ncbi:MAG: hypothetical protein HN855_08785 [Anaerolineae bacterium]|jgi:hypothetical protein|nr:hypothetical protein [Anaerolineae bacterium]MBT7071714.1 hypothetical protein [Anaerolineae bacterium]MBT7325240.1 hypothetical protein [Anaerolineae bacterium]
MSPNTILILSYILFIWLVVLHTFEEISCDVMGLELGHIKLTKNRYLLGASFISTLNLGTLALLVLGLPVGYYLALFTSAVLGVFQALVHTIGYIREVKKARGLGAGFFSSLPLAIAGVIVLIQLIQAIS